MQQIFKFTLIDEVNFKNFLTKPSKHLNNLMKQALDFSSAVVVLKFSLHLVRKI